MKKLINLVGFLSIAMLAIFGCNSNAQVNTHGNSSPMNKSGDINWETVLNYANNGAPTPDRRVEKTEAEWKDILTPEQFRITRKDGTERAYTGDHYDNYDPGVYACICCGTHLFRSEQKFKSGTGWPSFTAPLKDNVINYLGDNKYGMTRVEVECNVCDAHLGHVFNDGPNPTGLRYCINSVSLDKIDPEADK